MLKKDLQEKYDKSVDTIDKISKDCLKYKADAKELERKYEYQLSINNKLKRKNTQTLEDINLMCETFLDIEYPLREVEVKNAFYNDTVFQREDNKTVRLLNKVIEHIKNSKEN